MTSREIIWASLVRENGFATVAEIGVAQAFSASYVLNTSAVDKYYMVDPASSRGIIITLSKYRERAVFLCMTSEAASNQFDNESLDMVIIDALHDYDHVKQDLTLWLPKVRRGGIITGHDYNSKRFPGVKQAVYEVLGNNIKAFDVRKCQVFVWRKPF